MDFRRFWRHVLMTPWQARRAFPPAAMEAIGRAVAEHEKRHRGEVRFVVEAELGTPCRHFCCPWGLAGEFFDPTVHPAVARRVGYRSFLTTHAGFNRQGADPYAIHRRSFFAGDDPLIIRFLIARDWR